MRSFLALLAVFMTSPAIGQVSYPPGVTAVNGTPPDASGNVTVAVPAPASTVPPVEGVTPTVGTPGTYRPADSVVPRITRAANCTLIAGGTCSVTWATALLAAPTVIITPVNPSASQPLVCNSTATPTTATVAIKCWIDQTTTLSLAIVTTGLNLTPATPAPAGTVVQILAIPATQ